MRVHKACLSAALACAMIIAFFLSRFSRLSCLAYSSFAASAAFKASSSATKAEKRKVDEARMATAKAERTIVSAAAANQRRLRDLRHQLDCAQSKQATRLVELEGAKKAEEAAKEEYAKHESHENLNKRKSTIAAAAAAAGRHSLWTGNIAHLQGRIAKLSAE